jgi:Flp pilus assembly protein TadG
MRPVVKLIAGMMRLKGRMAADARGAAAVEFAALLPFMLMLYIGGVEVAQGVSADRRVTQTSRTVADLASRQTSVLTADVTNLLNASSAVMAPFDPTKVQVIVSQVQIAANGKATIEWSQALNTTARTVGQTVTLPAALATPSTYLLWGEATYLYTPAIGYYMTGTLTLYDSIYMAPRMSTCVQLNGAVC